MLVETYPGGSQSVDIASKINDDNYFAMYTVPYIDDVYSIMGYQSRLDANSDSEFYWGQDSCSRAEQFEDQKILDVSTAKAAIRYNKLQNDNEIRNPINDVRDPAAAIASRYDLRKSSDGLTPNILGSIDAKVRIPSSSFLSLISFSPSPSSSFVPLTILGYLSLHDGEANLCSRCWHNKIPPGLWEDNSRISKISPIVDSPTRFVGTGSPLIGMALSLSKASAVTSSLLALFAGPPLFFHCSLPYAFAYV